MGAIGIFKNNGSTAWVDPLFYCCGENACLFPVCGAPRTVVLVGELVAFACFYCYALMHLERYRNETFELELAYEHLGLDKIGRASCRERV